MARTGGCIVSGDGAGRTPWWYSGSDDAEPVNEPAAAPESAGMDWSALMVGAQRMVDWASEKVMAPHADHGDPSAHPDCMVCRTLLLVGGTERGPAAASADPPEAPEPIRWLPIRG